MSGVLLDTDIVIEVLRCRDSAIFRQWDELAAGPQPVFYSPVTAAELWHGMRPREEDRTKDLLASMVCLSVTDEIGRLAGRYLQQFWPSHGIELADALIGATASVHGCKLWTRNRKHYPMQDITLISESAKRGKSLL